MLHSLPGKAVLTQSPHSLVQQRTCAHHRAPQACPCSKLGPQHQQLTPASMAGLTRLHPVALQLPGPLRSPLSCSLAGQTPLLLLQQGRAQGPGCQRGSQQETQRQWGAWETGNRQARAQLAAHHDPQVRAPHRECCPIPPHESHDGVLLNK